MHASHQSPLPILHYSRLPWPTAWDRQFGRQGPLLVELGFGGGSKLIERARNSPQANILGIEISLPSLRRGAKKAAASGLQNVRVLQADSRAALWLLFRTQSISGVTIDFPDPWPKATHHHRRLINDRFLQLLATRMQFGAPLDVATDHEQYQAVVEECLLRAPWFESRDEGPYISQILGRIPTKYEQIALAEGRKPRYFRWRRIEAAAENSFPILEESPVPHVVIQPTYTLEEIESRFAPFHAQEDNIHISYLEMYHAVESDLLLVEAYVSEEPYHQRVGLAVRQRRDGDMVVSLHEIGFPRPTQGIHLAVRHLVGWLETEDPDLQIINSTLA